MGCRLYIRNPPEQWEEDERKAGRALLVEVAGRDGLDRRGGHCAWSDAQSRVEGAAARLRQAVERTQFVLDGAALAAVGGVMSVLGMITEGAAPGPPPECPAGVSRAEIEAAELSPGGAAVRPAAARYVRERHDYLAWHPDPPAGMSEHKLSSSRAGWLVTPAEIRAALDACRAHSPGYVGDLVRRAGITRVWPAWIAYLEAAQACGGAEVW